MINVYEELGDTSRRQILAELRAGHRNVSEICEATDLKQPNVSNHLARMRARGIVRATKSGRQVYYSLATPEIEAIVNSVFTQPELRAADVHLGELAKEYARAAVQGDEQTCSEIMDAAFRAQVSLIEIYEDLLAPAMTMVGNWWKVEAIDEAQEHMASAVTERMLARTSQIMGPMRRHGRVALLGCAPNSWHVIGLRMIGDYLRLHGWRTLFLGANVPVKSFITTVRNHRPTLVLLSCAAEESAPDTEALLKELVRVRDRRQPYTIGVGGAMVNQDPARFLSAGADFAAKDLRSFATEHLPNMDARSAEQENAASRN
jgi:methanogenic corrinoid protein MtbC1